MKNSSTVKYNENFLREKTEKEQSNITLSNKFQLLEKLDNIEDQWSQIKEVINSTCEETLGRKTHTQKEWITPATLMKVNERKQKKDKLNRSKTRKSNVDAQTDYNKSHMEVT